MRGLQSNREWKTWGSIDPLYAVATLPGRDRDGANPWTSDEFLALGKSDTADFLRHWRHYGVTEGLDAVCVEIGCGAGRMTAALLDYFGRIAAVDVSQHQIDAARDLLGARASRVTFALVTQPELPFPDASADGLFSTHVLQHLSDPMGGLDAYLRAASRVLKAGGSCCLHLPVRGSHRGAGQRGNSTLDALLKPMRHWQTGIRRLLGSRRIMEFHVFDPLAVTELFTRRGFKDVELRVFPLLSNGDPHSIFFARR